MNNIIDNDISSVIKSLGILINKFDNKKILFAGGGGFLGNYFLNFFKTIKNIRKINLKVVFVDNFISSANNFSGRHLGEKNFEFLNQDICNQNILNLKEKFDFVIHAAGIASPYYYSKKPLETLDVSITGSKNLLELARINNSKFIFFSSSEIYGDPMTNFVPIKETYRGNVNTTGPRSCYDEGKRVGETLCYIYQKYHNIHTNIIRPFNIYGPGMKKNDYRVMSNFTNLFLNHLPLNVYGFGNQTRTFCYISDGIEGFLRVILQGKSGNIYNIGNEKPEISMLNLAKLFFDIYNMPHNINKIKYPSSYPADEPNRRCPDITKAKTHLNFNAKVDLKSGIQNYVNWFMDEYNLKL